jgi:hypothetical protein
LLFAYDEGQLRRLFAAARKERGKLCGIPAGDWWLAYLRQ